MENIFFKPWIGKDYQTGGIFGKKILIIGEAHICGAGCSDCGNTGNAEECADFTSNHCIEQLIDGHTAGWTRTFRKFEHSLVSGDVDLEKSRAIWNSVAFYNYIQKSVDAPRTSPEPVDFQKSENAFFETLELLKPDLIIVWGVTRMYDNMPSKGWEKGESLIVDSTEVRNGWYTTDSGKRIRAIWVYHPSAGYSRERWSNVIKTVL